MFYERYSLVNSNKENCGNIFLHLASSLFVFDLVRKAVGSQIGPAQTLSSLDIFMLMSEEPGFAGPKNKSKFIN